LSLHAESHFQYSDDFDRASAALAPPRSSAALPEADSCEKARTKGENMLASALEVREVQNLHQILLLAVRQIKTLHATLGALMADVAAIRRTVLQDSDNVAHYRNNLTATMETARPLVDEAMQSYEDMIRQIEEFEELRN